MSRILTFSLAAVLLASPALAQGRGPGQGPRPGRGPAAGPQAGPFFMFRFLGLSEAQKTSLQALQEGHKASLEAKQAAFQAAEQAVRDAMPLGSVGESEFKALVLAAQAAHLPLALEHRLMLQEALAILTPAQRELWLKNHAEHPRGKGPGMGGGRPF